MNIPPELLEIPAVKKLMAKVAKESLKNDKRKQQ
jgi:hypothetical protein